ncbi:helix-turn-helix domain-containing protein [Alphaproteobacteria bacterium]|nr:helix-turn-helix domain-containing protein [Alphaproteobacteria bacterium]
MQKSISVLIFEKEHIFNSILEEQLSKINNYQITLIDDNENLMKIIKEFYFDIAIINLDDLKDQTLNLFEIFKDNNNNKKLIFYYDKLNEYKDYINDNGIIHIIKPLKLSILFDNIIDILNNEKNNKTIIYLMEHLIFHPVKKKIYNNKKNTSEYLTEKETNLLEYLTKNKNSEILKKNLLMSVWGMEKNINTHTLETHLYRLRQKLYKLEPNLTFSIINQNGKYILKNN